MIRKPRVLLVRGMTRQCYRENSEMTTSYTVWRNVSVKNNVCYIYGKEEQGFVLFKKYSKQSRSYACRNIAVK